jgi:RNA polymerase sigma-70 factor (ECF subfamily)
MNEDSRSKPSVAVPREFEALVESARPDLFRYCARMIGSATDAEDVVQEALAKAVDALPTTSSAVNLRGWLFRITHNKAIDHLRRTRNEAVEYLDERPPVPEQEHPLEERELVAVALSVFLKLTPKQRSCVILKDVLDYSLAEISEILDASVPDIKAALHRGRMRMREIAKVIDVDAPIALDTQEQARLAAYVDLFNSRNFDALRAMLAEDVQLDLVNRLKRRGRSEVGSYFTNYASTADWRLSAGRADGRPAILVHALEHPDSAPMYFVLVTWNGAQILQIQDFRYARHLIGDVQYAPL